MGRISLLYRSDDGQFLGAWDKEKQQWKPLETSQYDRAIKNGIAMALKQKSPSLISTPIILGNKIKQLKIPISNDLYPKGISFTQTLNCLFQL